MQHILSEFSAENLLFIVEVTQFQMYCRDVLNIGKEIMVKLPDAKTFAQSAIVFDDEMTLHEKVEKLIEKYILNSAEFQINISYNVFWNLKSFVDDKEKLQTLDNVKLSNVFDDSLKQIYALSGDSYSRFKRKEKYDKMLTSFSSRSAQNRV